MADVADHPTFDVELVTPDGPVFQGDAHMLIVPGAAGEIGVLARHAPLVATLKAGSTRVHVGANEVLEFATGPGFFKVELDRALALVDDAVSVKEIDDDRAREQLEAAQAELAKVEAATSPMTSGLPPRSWSSAVPPARRMRSATHSAARRTSPAWSGLALTDGIAISSASSATRASWVGITRRLYGRGGAHGSPTSPLLLRATRQGRSEPPGRQSRPPVAYACSPAAGNRLAVGVVVRLVERDGAGEARHSRPPRLAHSRSARAVGAAAEERQDAAASTAVPPRPQPPEHQATSRTLDASASARSFFRLWCSICRMRSRVTLNARPTSSSVRGWRPSSP